MTSTRTRTHHTNNKTLMNHLILKRKRAKANRHSKITKMQFVTSRLKDSRVGSERRTPTALLSVQKQGTTGCVRPIEEPQSTHELRQLHFDSRARRRGNGRLA